MLARNRTPNAFCGRPVDAEALVFDASAERVEVETSLGGRIGNNAVEDEKNPTRFALLRAVFCRVQRIAAPSRKIIAIKTEALAKPKRHDRLLH